MIKLIIKFLIPISLIVLGFIINFILNKVINENNYNKIEVVINFYWSSLISIIFLYGGDALGINQKYYNGFYLTWAATNALVSVFVADFVKKALKNKMGKALADKKIEVNDGLKAINYMEEVLKKSNIGEEEKNKLNEVREKFIKNKLSEFDNIINK